MEVLSRSLPLLWAVMGFAAQGIWHDYFWSRHPSVEFISIAGPLWAAFAILFIPIAIYSVRCAFRLGGMSGIGSVLVLLIAAFILALAAFAALMGGA